GFRESSPLDLHVLGTPPAFVLSQDQTLHEKIALPSVSRRIDGGRNDTRCSVFKEHGIAAGILRYHVLRNKSSGNVRHRIRFFARRSVHLAGHPEAGFPGGISAWFRPA